MEESGASGPILPIAPDFRDALETSPRARAILALRLEAAAALRRLSQLCRVAAASSELAASAVQLLTMSRIDRIPTTSAPSTTITWRKPPRTISVAACSSDQSDVARIA